MVEHLINLIWDVLPELLSTLVVFGVVVFRKRILRLYFSRDGGACESAFEKDQISQLVKDYVPVAFTVIGPDEKKEVRGASVVAYCINTVLTEENENPYLIIAPTGMGKTTLLANVYDVHCKSKRRSGLKLIGPSLIHGGIYSSKTKALIDKRIATGRAGSTVLLLDGLDEFFLDGYSFGDNVPSVDRYNEAFRREWKENEQKWVKFKKVIVTVRDQFLATTGNINFKDSRFGNRLWTKIHVRGFEEESQQREYLRRRFKEIPFVATVLSLKENYSPMLRIPFILKHLDAIQSRFDEVYKSKDLSKKEGFFKALNIYETIVDNWIAVEIEAKQLSLAASDFIRFCGFVAYTFNAQRNGFRISDLVELENENALESDSVIRCFIDGLSDRSLMVRVGDSHIKFVTDELHDFFVAKHILANPGVESSFDFSQNTYAARMIAGVRWRAAKGSVRALIAEEFSRAEPGQTLLTPPSLILTQKVYNVIGSLLNNAYLNGFLNSKIIELLEPEDSEWFETLRPTGHLYLMLKTSLCEEGSNEISEASKMFFTLATRYVAAVYRVQEIEMTDQDLIAMVSPNAIDSLMIESAHLNGECLQHIVREGSPINRITLSKNIIREQNLRPLLFASSLDWLELSECTLKGTCIPYFIHCPLLWYLDLSNNPLDPVHLPQLLRLPRLQQLKLLGCGIDGENPTVIELRRRGVEVMLDGDAPFSFSGFDPWQGKPLPPKGKQRQTP